MNEERRKDTCLFGKPHQCWAISVPNGKWIVHCYNCNMEVEKETWDKIRSEERANVKDFQGNG